MVKSLAVQIALWAIIAAAAASPWFAVALMAAFGSTAQSIATLVLFVIGGTTINTAIHAPLMVWLASGRRWPTADGHPSDVL